MTETITKTPEPAPVPASSQPQPALPISKKRLVLYLIILIFSLTGSVVFLSLKYQQTPPPTASSQCQTQPTTQDNWTAFQGTKSLVSLSYPPSWHVKEIADKRPDKTYYTLTVQDSESAFRNAIFVYSTPTMIPLKGDSVEADSDDLIAFTKSYIPGVSYNGPVQLEKEALTLDGRTGYRYLLQFTKHEDFTWDYESRIFLFDQKQYFLTIVLSGNDQKTLDQILSTFKFLEPSPTVQTEKIIWKTHNQQALNFKFDYPSDFILEDTLSVTKFCCLNLSGRGVGLTINAKLGGLDGFGPFFVDQWQSLNYSDAAGLSLGKVTSDYDDKKDKYPKLHSLATSQGAKFKDTGFMMLISYQEGNEQSRQLVDQILSTFRFTGNSSNN